MNNEEKILSILETLTEKVNGMDEKFNSIDARFAGIDARFDKIDSRLGKLEKNYKELNTAVVSMEKSHGDKLGVLFDGVLQNSQKLDRIEAEVTQQQEIIMRKIK